VDAKQHHPQEERSFFHFITGVDCSSSATIAAYINSLQFIPAAGTAQASSSSSGWFGGGSTHTSSITGSGKPIANIKSATYCVWNAFSRQDVRVEIRIPGGVEAYAIQTTAGSVESLPSR
jgi:hypothetical protein